MNKRYVPRDDSERILSMAFREFLAIAMTRNPQRFKAVPLRAACQRSCRDTLGRFDYPKLGDIPVRELISVQGRRIQCFTFGEKGWSSISTELKDYGISWNW